MRRKLITAGLICIFLLSGCGAETDAAPTPAQVQVVNPILEVESVSAMEEYLDFTVPVLDKEIEQCIVLVIDGYPRMGRVLYADGSEFRIQYGSGDISGIYGGAEDKAENINSVQVRFFIYEDIRYALWETDGFSCCLMGAGELETEVAALIR